MKLTMICLLTCTLVLTCIKYAKADCQVSLSKQDVNYGQIKRDDIEDSKKQWNSLAEREVNVTAWCSEPQKIALFFEGKTGEKEAFTFGDWSGLLIKAGNATLDGQEVMLNHTTTHTPFSVAGQSGMEHVVHAHQGLLPVRGGEILEGKQFSVTLTLKPVLNSKELIVKDKHDITSDLQISVEEE